MPYVISYHAPWILAALALGLIAGAITRRDDRPNLMDGTVWIFVVAWLIGCVIAVAKLLPGRIGFMLELGLLMCFAYGVGCLIGWAVLRWKSETEPYVALDRGAMPRVPMREEPAMLSNVTAWIKGKALGPDPNAPSKSEATEPASAIAPATAAHPPNAAAPNAAAPTARPVTLGDQLPPDAVLNVTREGVPSMMRDRFTRVFNATVVETSDHSASHAPGSTPSTAPVIPMRSTMFAAAKQTKPAAPAPVAPQPIASPMPEPTALNGAARPEAARATDPGSPTDIVAALSNVRQRLHLPSLSSVKSRLDAERKRVQAALSNSGSPPNAPDREPLDRSSPDVRASVHGAADDQSKPQR